MLRISLNGDFPNKIICNHEAGKMVIIELYESEELEVTSIATDQSQFGCYVISVTQNNLRSNAMTPSNRHKFAANDILLFYFGSTLAAESINNIFQSFISTQSDKSDTSDTSSNQNESRKLDDSQMMTVAKEVEKVLLANANANANVGFLIGKIDSKINLLAKPKHWSTEKINWSQLEC